MEDVRPQRDLWIGVGTGFGVAILTYVLLLGLLALAYVALLAGLLIINPTPIIFALLGIIALAQVILGAVVATRTTREKRTLAKNLRRTFFISVLLIVLTSPLYICPMMFAFGGGMNNM
ncbi:MAG: hypothetical protein AAF125_23195 [Chloroflexota bacterium]